MDGERTDVVYQYNNELVPLGDNENSRSMQLSLTTVFYSKLEKKTVQHNTKVVYFKFRYFLSRTTTTE